MHAISLVSVAIACFLGTTARAQGRVHKVDPTSATAFATIDAALAAAAPGDVIVVSAKPQTPGVQWSNLYPPIRIDKSIAITSEAGHDARCWSAEIATLGDQDRVVIRGIRFERPTLLVTLGLPTLSVADCRGHVFLEDCSFQPAAPVVVGVGSTWPAIDIRGPSSGPPGSVTLVRCSVRGIDGVTNPRSRGHQLPAPGIRAAGSSLALWNCAITGGRGANAYPTLNLPAGAGADAVLFDGYAFASGTTVAGGAGGDAIAGTCGPGGNGGAGLVLAQASTLVEALACTIGGGNGGGGCPAGAPGPAESRGAATLVRWSWIATAIEATSPHRAGQTTVLTHSGSPGGAFFAFAGSAPDLVRTTPLGLLGVRSVAGPGSAAPLYAGSYAANGQVALPVLLPPTGREGAVFLLQTAAFLPPNFLANSAPTALFVLAARL